MIRMKKELCLFFLIFWGLAYLQRAMKDLGKAISSAENYLQVANNLGQSSRLGFRSAERFKKCTIWKTEYDMNFLCLVIEPWLEISVQLVAVATVTELRKKICYVDPVHLFLFRYHFRFHNKRIHFSIELLRIWTCHIVHMGKLLVKVWGINVNMAQIKSLSKYESVFLQLFFLTLFNVGQ